jgi:hypothetical protein
MRGRNKRKQCSRCGSLGIRDQRTWGNSSMRGRQSASSTQMRTVSVREALEEASGTSRMRKPIGSVMKRAIKLRIASMISL